MIAWTISTPGAIHELRRARRRFPIAVPRFVRVRDEWWDAEWGRATPYMRSTVYGCAAPTPVQFPPLPKRR